MSDIGIAQLTRSEIVRRAIRKYRAHGLRELRELAGLVNQELVEYGHKTLSQGEITAMAFAELGN